MNWSASYVWLAATESPAAEFADPAIWVNLGVAGVFLFAFFMGRLHSPAEMTRVEKAHAVAFEEQRKSQEAAINAHRDAAEAAMQRLDDQVRQLILERDRALAERDEMIGVMKDFTLMAGAVLNQDQPWRRTAKNPPPRRGGTSRGEGE